MKVLVLQVSGLHPHFLGCYGNDWVATDTFDRLAAEGVVFDRHFADGPDQARSAWTGRYAFPGVKPEHPGTSGDLRDLLARSNIPFVHVEQTYTPQQFEGEEAGYFDVTCAQAIVALEDLAPTPDWLLWVDLPDLFPPWSPSPATAEHYFADEEAEEEGGPLTPLTSPPTGAMNPDDAPAMERVRLTYAAVVTDLDLAVGGLVEYLRETGLLDQLVLVVLSDRGIALGEHGFLGETAPAAYEELTHLPLLLRFPDSAQACRRVEALTQPVDIFPTLLELFGQPGADTHGLSLLPLARGECGPARAYACTALNWQGATAWALRTADWAVLVPADGGEPRLFVKPDDRWEVNDVFQHYLDRGDALHRTLRDFVAAARQPGPLRPPALPELGGAAETTGQEETAG